MDTIFVATTWTTNAQLLTQAVFPILRAAGLWQDDDSALDVTYHKGTWWTNYRPTNLTYHSRLETPEFDYRKLPHEDDSFDLVAFDPPYIAKGGPSSPGTYSKFDQAYGISDRIRPNDLLDMNIDGLRESIRVARNVILMKSMDFVSEGVLHCHTSSLEQVARRRGWVVYERFIHVPNNIRPQPPSKRVLRGRARPSTLSILVPDRLKRGYTSRMPKMDKDL